MRKRQLWLEKYTGGRSAETPNELAMKAASSAMVSPSGFVIVTRWAPASRAGVTTVSVFISLKVTVAALPPMVAVGAVLKTAAANRESCSAGRRAVCRSQSSDAQGDIGQFYDRDACVLRCAVFRGDGEQALTVFVNGEEAAVKTIDVGHELLGKKDTQAKRASVSVEDVHATMHFCVCCGGEEDGRGRPGGDTEWAEWIGDDLAGQTGESDLDCSVKPLSGLTESWTAGLVAPC
jgi:hypothetical protein